MTRGFAVFSLFKSFNYRDAFVNDAQFTVSSCFVR